jgi:hypothetical protein
MDFSCKRTDLICEHRLKQSLEVCGDCLFLNIIETKDTDLDKKKQPNTESALRYNEGKLQWSYVHFKSLEPMVRVLEFGALKYAPKNWMKPMDTTKILESMQRHLAALFDGEEYDPESGISHMGHIQCNALFYNYHKERERLEKLKNK